MSLVSQTLGYSYHKWHLELQGGHSSVKLILYTLAISTLFEGRHIVHYVLLFQCRSTSDNASSQLFAANHCTEKVLFHLDTSNTNWAVMSFSSLQRDPPPTKTNQQDFFFQFISEPFKSVLRQEIFYFRSLASFFLLLLFSNWDISNFETRKFFSITFQLRREKTRTCSICSI